jgi:hypothetical protein
MAPVARPRARAPGREHAHELDPDCPDASVNTSTPASTRVPPPRGCRYQPS